MPRKKLDPRIRTLVENGVKEHFRSMFVIVGDKGRDQVVNLHYLLSKAQVKARPSVLWCYKKELGFSSHRKKRMKQIKNDVMRGLRDPDQEDPFDMFVAATNIRYIYYRDTHKVLGNTYGMCVLQDFEAMTPNLLARTIESVEGGGIIVILLRTMTSLRQLYSLSMDVHARYRTESHQKLIPRFNERFILSLSTNRYCLATDDELNVLPITEHIREIKPVVVKGKGEENGKGKDEEDSDDLGESAAIIRERSELAALSKSLHDTQPAGVLVSLTKTLDQAKAVLSFIEAISEKTLRTTVSLTAGRGRGKSAAMGLAVAGAVAVGYANIFVTSPSPENLKTFWAFVLKGLEKAGYTEHTDYEIMQSTNPEFQEAIVRVNVFREQHRQTIQYILPQDSQKLAQAELVVVDECAAIPLTVVRKLLGPYLVFLSSTVSGYEGTGRSLSLKLIKELRERSSSSSSSSSVVMGGRVLREVSLDTPIRYASNDPVEQWLYRLLCLDATVKSPTPSPTPSPSAPKSKCPHPSQCELYHVSRDALFSFHSVAESFLQRVWSLYVSAHYKNSPNDLQLLSDAPAHSIFVLLGPVDPQARSLPDVLTVIQVAYEGAISTETAKLNSQRAQRPTGDLIPWTLSQQYQDYGIAQLSGARVVRIATDPQYQGMGYGAKALELMSKYFEGGLYDADAADADGEGEGVSEEEKDEEEEMLQPRKKLPPLLQKVSHRAPERLHYYGVSFGLTQQLFNFWSRESFVPLYLRLTPNELTGEHTCIMLRSLDTSEMELSVQSDWIVNLNRDFRRRCISLLGYQIRDMTTSLALSIVSAPSTAATTATTAAVKEVEKSALDIHFTPHDLERLESYSRNLVDYHVILDLIPRIATLYFTGQLPSVSLSRVQCALMVCIGLQCQDIEHCASSLNLPIQQVMALFNKACRKFSTTFRRIAEREHEKALPRTVLGSTSTSASTLKIDPEAMTTATLEEDIADGLAMATSKNKNSRSEGEGSTKQLLGIDVSHYSAPPAMDIDGDVSLQSGFSVARVKEKEKEKEKEKGKEKGKKRALGSGSTKRDREKGKKKKHSKK